MAHEYCTVGLSNINSNNNSNIARKNGEGAHDIERNYCTLIAV